MRKIFAFLGVFLLFTSVSFGLTLSEIRTEVRRNIKDTGQDSSRQRFSDTILNSFINEGQRDVVNRTWALRKTATIDLTSQTTYYDLQSDLIAITDAFFTNTGNGRVTVLIERLERSFRQDNPDFEKNTGRPTEYFVRITTGTANPLEIGIWPVITSASTGTVTYVYVSQGTDLSSDSDEPFDGLDHLAPYHDALIYYVSAKTAVIENMVDVATIYNQLYEAKIGFMRQRINDAPNFNPSMRTRTISTRQR